MSTIELIHAKLASLSPLEMEIRDDSGRHIGHAGAADGGHYRLYIVAECFTGASKISRHRQIYAALAELMQTRIHALAIDARSPDELS